MWVRCILSLVGAAFVALPALALYHRVPVATWLMLHLVAMFVLGLWCRLAAVFARRAHVDWLTDHM